ncbi:MAG: UDP-N-acetylmuramoyl-L-alanyl-D-glutamate--2,6-diaminopimelate ligase [Ruminococcaceae bacterium]|nr:UDP-N-acetylmuramoyl-L-alanyl-D-glutamate--2,6-diaminopimelate ligase [Oscillospiraceae bacterium]
MKLSQILENAEYTIVQGGIDAEISDIIYDSRKLVTGCVFVCMVGAVVDGHSFIPEAIEKGAIAVVVEKDVENIPANITVIKVTSTRRALALMSAAFFGEPAKELITVGLTGTKGKTTTTYMIKSVLESAGFKTGLIGTTGVLIGHEKLPTKNTTPESYELHKLFRQMVDKGCKYAVMEVSSQGLKLDRTAGIEFDFGVFTNLSPDHIGPHEHDSFEEYIDCKSMLFRQCKTAIVNADDEHTNAVLKGHTCKVLTFSAKGQADLKASDIEFIKDGGNLGMRFNVSGKVNTPVVIYTPGLFSVYNSLVTILCCALLGAETNAILEGLLKVKVKGRVEIVPCSDDFSVIIDYAHNEVSTKSVLTTLMEYKPNRMICVFGGGGNRSRMRRYDMGEVAGAMADLCVLTEDNPRDEDLRQINDDIKIGLAKSNGKYIEIDDRKEAIKYCIQNAQKGDMIVLLGKGHQTYQERKGVKYHFDEREAVAQIKEELGI